MTVSVFIKGRMYDYNNGRFLSVDPFIQAPTSTQSMNPYTYIFNNPLSGTDPSGYCSTSDSVASCGEGLKAGESVNITKGDKVVGTATKGKNGELAISNGTRKTGQKFNSVALKNGNDGSGVKGALTAAAASPISGKVQSSQIGSPKAQQANSQGVPATTKGIVPTAAQEAAFANLTLSSVQGADASRETKFYMDDKGSVLGTSQNGCKGGDICTISKSELPNSTTLIGHTHVGAPQSTSSSAIVSTRTQGNELSRNAPGPGDASPLRLGKGFVSGIITADGYHYLIYGTTNKPIVKYLGGGADPNFGKFIEKNWKPDNKHIKRISKRYISIRRKALKAERKAAKKLEKQAKNKGG